MVLGREKLKYAMETKLHTANALKVKQAAR